MRVDPHTLRRLMWVILFGVGFGFVESSVVVYLRALYYPAGFQFPLKLTLHAHLITELAREVATIIMLVAVAAVAGSKGWEKFGYFLVAFGVWDIFYYVWLKLLLNWPASLTDWDVLFLIPLPWVGPVIAPVLVSLCMIVYGVIIVHRISMSRVYRPTTVSWILFIVATIVLFSSFVVGSPAVVQGDLPVAYRYELLAISLVLYAVGFIPSIRSSDLPSRNV